MDDIKFIRFLRDAPACQFKTTFENWDKSVRRLWNGNTAVILETLGTDAGKIFIHSLKTQAYLESIAPGSTAATAALRRPHTIHDDGRVTLD